MEKKLLSANVNPETLINYLENTKTYRSIAENIKVTYIVKNIVDNAIYISPYAESEIDYECEVKCTFNNKCIGKFTANYPKTVDNIKRKGEVAHERVGILYPEFMSLIKKNIEARRTIIEYLNITEGKLNREVKEKELRELKKNLEEVKNILSEKYRERKRIDRDIETLEDEERKYLEEIDELKSSKPNSKVKKVGTK